MNILRYSPKLVEGVFSELRLYRVLGSCPGLVYRGWPGRYAPFQHPVASVPAWLRFVSQKGGPALRGALFTNVGVKVFSEGSSKNVSGGGCLTQID